MAKKSHARRSALAAGAAVACMTASVWTAPLSAQTLPAERSQSSGIHFLAGGFVGRFDLDGAGSTDLYGAQAGVGYGELLQLTGFYWRDFDRSANSVTADRAWGGEVQFNLNAGFGLTPFLTGGIGRVRIGEAADQTAALAGAGLTLPLWRVLLHVAVRDYMFGVTGLENDDSPEDVTHNWLYSAGVKLALGERRREAGVVAAAPPDDRALQVARAELAALRDSVRLGGGEPAGLAESPADSSAGSRNYHSTQRIEIPLPTEGSITLRYGPERVAEAAPVVVPIGGESLPLAATVGETGAALAAPGETLDDPATEAWLQQQVAAQVALQLSRTPAPTSALTPEQMDVLVQRVVDGVLVTILPQLEAAQARRIDGLREDLRVALQQQWAAGRADVAGAQPPLNRTDTAGGETPDVPPSAPSPVREPTPELPPADTSLAAVHRESALRTALAAVVSAHPAYLAARETERGRAAVVGGAAFATGAAVTSSGALPAIRALAAMLRAHPEGRVYIQGHTDAVGGERSNQRLSERRAEAVRALLVQEGVAADRLIAIGFGETRPVADNATPEGRAQNRRVEIVIGESRTQSAR